MTAISECFAALRARQECALIPFITAGDPSLELTAAALRQLDQNGADLIELGVPYSDPLADGPVIQAAATRALTHGTKLNDVLKLVQQVSPELTAPIILFTYYNPILNRGIPSFLEALANAGVKGLVVPDLPLEESSELATAAAQRGIDLILLIAPTSSDERIAAIANQSQGFIYLVSVTGVTGIRQEVQTRVGSLLQQIRQTTDKPIGVGFGISSPEQAQQVKAWGADAVIVGSAFVKRLADPSETGGVPALAQFCRHLRDALKT